MRRFLRMSKDYFRFHFKLVKYAKWYALLSYAVSVIQGLMPTFNTLLLAFTATLLPEGKRLTGALLLAVFGIGVTIAANNALNALNEFLSAKIKAKIDLPMQEEFHNTCCSLDYRYREKREAADLMERAVLAIDKNTISAGITSIPASAQAFLSFVLSAALLWRYGWYMPVLATIFAVCECVCSYIAIKKGNEFFNMQTTEERKIMTYSTQMFDKSVFIELKAFNKLAWIISKWKTSFRALRKKTFVHEMRYKTLENLGYLVESVMILILVMVFMLTGGKTFAEGTGAAIVIVINACASLSNAVTGIREQYSSIQLFSEYIAKYYELAHKCEKVEDARTECKHAISVVLNDVHFSYDDEKEALSGVDLQIPAGEKLAIVGENGSGKTTLAKLILSLYKPTSGTLTLSNASGVLSDARASAVMQEYVRYLLSVRENIGFGDPEKLTDDAALTAAYESVTGEPLFDALDAQLGAKFGGRELSGGQWQRLALARAYLKEAPLIVLDEPNASIDAFAEAAMIKRMFAMAKDKTCIFITHRLTTTALADRIIVMKDGRICEEGTHEELMRRNGEYARMYSVQAEMYA